MFSLTTLTLSVDHVQATVRNPGYATGFYEVGQTTATS